MLSCDVKLCQEFWCQKLLKSDNYSSTYRQQYEWMFFFLKHGVVCALLTIISLIKCCWQSVSCIHHFLRYQAMNFFQRPSYIVTVDIEILLSTCSRYDMMML